MSTSSARPTTTSVSMSSIVLSSASNLNSATATTILNTVTNIGVTGAAGGYNFVRGLTGKRKKRPQNHPVIFSAVPNTYVDKNNDFIW